MKGIQIKNILITLLAFCVVYIIFKDFGSYPIRLWDESVYANNAVDMYLSGDWWNVQKDGVLDLTNTKPTLVIWLQVVFMYVLGISEWAIRMPTGLFVLGTVIVIYKFSERVLGNVWVGVYSSLILLTINGYMNFHVAKTGDLDAGLIFWTTSYVLFFIAMLLKKKITTKNIFLFSAMVFCGFMTKGVAGLFLIPSIFVLSLLPNNFKTIFAQKKLYIAAITVIGMILLYYLLRNLGTEGYIAKVWQTELVRYTSSVMSFHERPFWFYGEVLSTNFYFFPYFYCLPLVTVLGVSRKYRKIGFYLVLVSIVFFMFISVPSNKLDFYIAPIYPLLSLIIGLSLYVLLETLLGFLKMKKRYSNIVLGLLVLGAWYPYTEQQKQANWIKNHYAQEENEGHCIKVIKERIPSIQKFTVYKESHKLGAKEDYMSLYNQILFYKRAYGHEYGYEIQSKGTISFAKDEIVLVCRDDFLEKIGLSYRYTKFKRLLGGRGWLLRIEGEL